MKILHTSDWHLGKVLKGQSRRDEQVAVLLEIISVAEAERPDLVIVAGDMFDTTAPSPETKKILVRALSALRRHADAVVVIAGNHDNAAEIDALRPWADGAGVTLRGTIGPAADHVITGTTPGGEAWRLAALPFVSQRYAVRATEMFELSGADAAATYADHVARLIAALTADFDGGADGPAGTTPVNLVTSHLTVLGGTLGGGERDAHTIEAYAVPATVFPRSAHYVALGHLHRRQQVPGPCPVHYCGSPLSVDFGEEANAPSVSLVEVTAHTAAKVRPVSLSAATPLRTVRGTLAELAALTVPEEAWLRVYVREPQRAGLREEVQALLPRALEVRLDPQMLAESAPSERPSHRAGRSPAELFADYLTTAGVADEAVTGLFGRLYEEVSA